MGNFFLPIKKERK